MLPLESMIPVPASNAPLPRFSFLVAHPSSRHGSNVVRAVRPRHCGQASPLCTSPSSASPPCPPAPAAHPCHCCCRFSFAVRSLSPFPLPISQPVRPFSRGLLRPPARPCKQNDGSV